MLKYAKALIGGMVAGLGSAEATLQSGTHFAASSYIAAIIAGLIAFSGIAFIPNKQ